MAANGMSPYGPIGGSGNADLENARAVRAMIGAANAGYTPGAGIATGWTGPTVAAPVGSMYNPIGATPYSAPVSTTRPAMAYGPGGTLGGFGIPAQRPQPPAGVQQPTASAPLTGTNALAGVPGGPYTAMPGGFAGGYAGATGMPAGTGLLAGARKSPTTYGGYDSINGGLLAGLGIAGMAVPGLGLLGTTGHVYNTEEYSNALSKLGMPSLSLLQRIGGYLGLNDYGYGGQGPSTKDNIGKSSSAFADSVAAGAQVHGSNNAGMGGPSKASGQSKPDKGGGYSGSSGGASTGGLGGKGVLK